ncbi:uncharacterized protein LOC121294926 [Polyodon spathula]|uniref:uncharacterized protein LOC121294422 n=1 Tax=Polyodon spathula TaxID=7913 RepID=UPI001B7F6A56|nr:uncharacterized protein LOC121294422 [Polyodon spathula]XP_041075069.1 uncharacterized protein LOC121294926 [Polyodon spathula]
MGRMYRIWIILYALLDGAKGFVIKNAHHRLCLQAVSEYDSLVLVECDLNSSFQQWFWRDSLLLVSMATGKCLSAPKADSVQTAACENEAHLQWDCHNMRLISKANSYYLTANESKVAILSSKRSSNSKWRGSTGGVDICKERLEPHRATRKADGSKTAQPDPASHAGETQTEGMTDAQREKLLWFYRTEDPSPWKYAILALSFVALLFGLFILGLSSMAMKNRKVMAQYKAASKANNPLEMERMLEQEKQTHDPFSHKLPSKTAASDSLKTGNITIQWKDGTVSTLFQDHCEENV